MIVHPCYIYMLLVDIAGGGFLYTEDGAGALRLPFEQVSTKSDFNR